MPQLSFGFLTSLKGRCCTDTHIRVVRGDDQWLSPTSTASGGDTLAIGFGLSNALWGDDGSDLYEACAALEKTLGQFGPVRPHCKRSSEAVAVFRVCPRAASLKVAAVQGAS